MFSEVLPEDVRNLPFHCPGQLRPQRLQPHAPGTGCLLSLGNSAHYSQTFISTSHSLNPGGKRIVGVVHTGSTMSHSEFKQRHTPAYSAWDLA